MAPDSLGTPTISRRRRVAHGGRMAVRPQQKKRAGFRARSDRRGPQASRILRVDPALIFALRPTSIGSDPEPQRDFSSIMHRSARFCVMGPTNAGWVDDFLTVAEGLGGTSDRGTKGRKQAVLSKR